MTMDSQDDINHTEYYRERVKDESAALEATYLDIDFINGLLEGSTPGPWHWVVHDYSMATMQGPAEEWDHVCSVSPCDACCSRAKDGEWKWGRCSTPTEPNANLMAIAPTIAKQYVRLAMEVEQLRKYPIIYDQNIYQYSEHVFVWFDEAGLVGGAANTLEQAQSELRAYVKAML